MNDALKNTMYYRINPVIHLVIRPTLRLVDAHNHPIRGGLAAGLVAWLAHYLLIFPFAWKEDLTTTLGLISPLVHFLFGIVLLSNVGIGLIRFASRPRL